MENRSRVTALSTVIVTIVVLAAGIIFLIKNSHIFFILRNISPPFLSTLFIITILYTASNGYFSKIVLSTFSVNLSFREWFFLSFVTSLINLITPLRGGAAYRAWYFKKLYNFSYALFIAQLGSSVVLALIIGSLCGLISAIYFASQQKPFAWYLVSAFFILLLITYRIIRSKVTIRDHSYFFLKKIKGIVNGWQMIHSNTLLVSKLALNILITYSLGFILLFLAYKSLQINISFMAVVFISIVSSFSVLFNVTPGNLGVREAIITLCGMYSGIDMVQAAAASLLIRGVEVAVITTSAGIGFLYLSQRVRKRNEEF